MLRKLGATSILEAETGAEAERLFRDNPVQLILLDMHLPDMTGLEVARLVRAIEVGRILGSVNQAPPCLIVALSGDAELMEECTRTELTNAFLLKPATMEQIEDAVAKSLAARDASIAAGRADTAADSRML